MACIGTDGGEPEDNTLNRDWSWVVGALNDAHRQGVMERLLAQPVKEN